MYLHKVIIQNIRSIQHLEMEWTAGKEAGWHILIGDNGVGKSSVLRAISLALIGQNRWGGLYQNWANWLNSKSENGSIELSIFGNCGKAGVDQQGKGQPTTKAILNKVNFERDTQKKDKVNIFCPDYQKAENYNWGDNAGWFSAGFGTFRRLSGGNPEKTKIFHAAPRLGAHLSIFGEDIALTEALAWLKELDDKIIRRKQNNIYNTEEEIILNNIKIFINKSGLFPHNTQFEKMDDNGQPVFIDANKQPVGIVEMSDGYRSISSLAFELLRQLISVYGTEKTFEGFSETTPYIQAEGVVLIDEIDAHLHPSWQVKIGDWFLTHFPKIQFICTTHSPLICRACGENKGQIWRLEFLEENGSQINKLEGIARDRLVFGNILDAYGTEVFGRVAVSPETQKLRLEKVELQNAQYERDLTEAETQRLRYLQTILPTTR